jgi:hypothetical protein
MFPIALLVKVFQQVALLILHSAVMCAVYAGVVTDVTSWQRQVHALDEHVQRFKAARLRYDYYTKKVDDVRTQAAAAVEKKSKDAATLQDRLQRYVFEQYHS